MSLSLSLSNALSGLNVSRQSMAVLSQNIANANTKGYSRQIISQQALYLVGSGAGVSIDEVSRKVDDFLVRAVRLQSATSGRADTATDYYDRSQLLLGKPGSQDSLPSYLSTFFNAAQSLAQTPENASQRVNVINTGVTLARQLQAISQGLQELRYQADQDIKLAVDTINQDIHALKDLNTAIRTDLSLGRSAAGLQDSRDILLRDMAQYLDIQTFVRETGEISIATTGGISLLDDNEYLLSYRPAPSAASFTDGVPLNALTVSRIDEEGDVIGDPVVIASAGVSGTNTTSLLSGKIKGLLDMRDTQLPNLLAQLDTFAANFRDEVNRIHNSGVSFPGANSYTGARSVIADDFSQWAGSMRIAVLDTHGQPVDSQYDDEISGARPITIDLSQLDSGDGEGSPSVQGVIDEINRYLSAAQNRVKLGNINNIRLASDSEELPGIPPQFDFDFDLENISATDAKFFVTGVQVLDDTSADISSVTTPTPPISITNYVTTASSRTVTVNTGAAHGFSVGDRVYLTNPGAVDGIPDTELSELVTITSVTSTSFQFSTTTAAGAGGTFVVASQTATPSYADVDAGEYSRTRNDGVFSADLSGNDSSDFYTIVVSVVVDDGGSGQTAQITYRVDSNAENLFNDRYSAQAVGGMAILVPPATSQSLGRALLVDEDGHELPKTEGIYTTTQRGFLKIQATNSQHVIAIDSLDSQEQGHPNSSPVVAGTEEGFSYYFGLNNFFKSLDPGLETDLVTNAANTLEVEDRLRSNPNLISLGALTQSASLADGTPAYTYERNIGDNSLIQRLAGLANLSVSFAASGGIGASDQTLGAYAGQVIGAASANAAAAHKESENAKVLLDGYSQRSDAISGVNLDEELANTIIYQNAYTASARVITVTNDLFKTLLDSV